MAYVEKYFGVFSESVNPSGVQKDYRISFKEDSFAGSATEIRMGGAAVDFEEVAGNDTVYGVKETRAIISFVGDDALSGEDFYTTTEKTIQVDITDVTGGGSTLIWRGWLSPRRVDDAYVDGKRTVKITATDGLNYLNTLDFRNDSGVKYDGEFSYWALIRVLLGKTGLSLGLKTVYNIYPASLTIAANVEPLAFAGPNVYVYDGIKCGEILKRIADDLKVRIFQEDGLWLVHYMGDEGTGKYQRTYDSAGTLTSSGEFSNAITVQHETEYQPRNGNKYLEPGYRRILNKLQIGNYKNVLTNGEFTTGATGFDDWTVSSGLTVSKGGTGTKTDPYYGEIDGFQNELGKAVAQSYEIAVSNIENAVKQKLKFSGKVRGNDIKGVWVRLALYLLDSGSGISYWLTDSGKWIRSGSKTDNVAESYIEVDVLDVNDTSIEEYVSWNIESEAIKELSLDDEFFLGKKRDYSDITEIGFHVYLYAGVEQPEDPVNGVSYDSWVRYSDVRVELEDIRLNRNMKELVWEMDTGNDAEKDLEVEVFTGDFPDLGMNGSLRSSDVLTTAWKKANGGAENELHRWTADDLMKSVGRTIAGYDGDVWGRIKRSHVVSFYGMTGKYINVAWSYSLGDVEARGARWQRLDDTSITGTYDSYGLADDGRRVTKYGSFGGNSSALGGQQTAGGGFFDKIRAMLGRFELLKEGNESTTKVAWVNEAGTETDYLRPDADGFMYLKTEGNSEEQIATAETAWMLGATNALTASSSIGSASGDYDINLKRAGTTIATLKSDMFNVVDQLGISGGIGSTASPAYTELSFRGYLDQRTALIRSYDQSASNVVGGGIEFLVNANMLADTLTPAALITGTGDMGVGTVNPQKKFVVSDGGNIGIEFSPNDGAAGKGRVLVYNRATSAYVPALWQASQHEFYVEGSEVVRIEAGKLQVGTTSGTKMLTVGGDIQGTEITLTTGKALGYVAISDANGKVVWTDPSSLNPWAGNWNASTNTPTLADGTGTYGEWYHVETAGSQDLGSGSITFAQGDRVIYDGSVWVKQTQNYTLNPATASVLGGIKIGSTLEIDAGTGVANQKSGVATTGTYRSVTVDTYGRVTAGTNPTTLAGYGITDAYTSTEGAALETILNSSSLTTNYMPKWDGSKFVNSIITSVGSTASVLGQLQIDQSVRIFKASSPVFGYDFIATGGADEYLKIIAPLEGVDMLRLYPDGRVAVPYLTASKIVGTDANENLVSIEIDSFADTWWEGINTATTGAIPKIDATGNLVDSNITEAKLNFDGLITNRLLYWDGSSLEGSSFFISSSDIYGENRAIKMYRDSGGSPEIAVYSTNPALGGSQGATFGIDSTTGAASLIFKGYGQDGQILPDTTTFGTLQLGTTDRKWASIVANSHITATGGISETLTLTEDSFERVLKGLYLSGGDTDTRETFFVGTDFNTGAGVFRLQYYNPSDELSAVEMSFDLTDSGRPIVYDPNDATEAIKHVMYQEDFATMLSNAGVSTGNTPTLQEVLDAGTGDTTKQISLNNSPYITREKFNELTANFGGAQGLKSVLSNGTLAENQEINFQQTSATATGSGSGLVFLDESSVEKGYLNYSNNDDVLSLSASSGYMKIYSSGEIDLRNASAVGFSTSGSNLAVYADKLLVTYDLELQHVGPDRGIILKSPDGTRYRVTIDNSGNLTSALA